MAGTKRRQVYTSAEDTIRILRSLIITGAVFVIAIVVGIVSSQLRYHPPEHDENAKSGLPIVEDSYLYREIETDFGYSFSMAANLYRQEDGSLNLYLTNPETNDVDLMCEINDMESGQLLYKSGRILPGEYLVNIPCAEEFENDYHDVSVRIYAFDREKFTSEGTTELSLALQPW